MASVTVKTCHACSAVVTLMFEVLQVVSRRARKSSYLLDRLNEVEGWMQVGDVAVSAAIMVLVLVPQRMIRAGRAS